MVRASMMKLLAAGTLLATAGLAGAQVAAPTPPSPNPATQSLNSGVLSSIDAINTQNDVDAAQYAVDRARYRAALAANRNQRAVNREQQSAQEAAYASAMRDWRNQYYACRHGTQAACKAALPDVADYYAR